MVLRPDRSPIRGEAVVIVFNKSGNKTDWQAGPTRRINLGPSYEKKRRFNDRH